ncbi:MAG: hypothetical protein JXX28_17575 [Deltaproteobacteria bacterium]|nr:hypothetical protein [Deltaproteobacteria bacterium]
MVIDDSWTICADEHTLSVAKALVSGDFLRHGDSEDPYATLGDFPQARHQVIGAKLPDACTFSQSKVIYVRDWSTVPPPPVPFQPGHHRTAYKGYFPALQGWERRLIHDPQSYAISYSTTTQRIAVIGGSALGAQYGLVSLLRDSDHDPVSEQTEWIPKSVLDYPELLLRVTSYREMNRDDEDWIRPWMNATTWNRYTHVSNDTQVFNSLATDPTYRASFGELADYFTDRNTRFIPRLMSGPATLISALDISGGPILPPLLDPKHDIDLTGTLLPPRPCDSNPEGCTVTDGIHLTEGMRVRVEPGTDFVPPSNLAPTQKEALHLARGHSQCVFYDSLPDDAWNQPTSPYLPDCRTRATSDAAGGEDPELELITLCGEADCPTLDSATSAGATLKIFLDAGGDYLFEDGERAYDINQAPDTLSTDPFDFMPGHAYLLAIRYRLPEPSAADSGEATIELKAGMDDHAQLKAGFSYAFLPTGDALAWTSFVFRVPEPVVGSERVHLVLPTADDSSRNYRVQINTSALSGRALQIQDLELYDLSQTLAYPRVEKPLLGRASCRGLVSSATGTADPGCTMRLDRFSGRYPEDLLVDLTDTSPTSSLDLPTASFAGEVDGGYYHTVLTPGLWPRLEEYETDTDDEDEDGDHADLIARQAPYPVELLPAQDFERQRYWEPYQWEEVDGKNYLTDGYLGGQLEELAWVLEHHADFLEPRLLDHTQAYTEARGFNRGEGRLATRASTMERISYLHCRLSQELEAMGYDDGVLTEGYVPGASPGPEGGSCLTGLHTSLLYYADMFTPAHNGIMEYNAPYSGGAPWTSGAADPFELEDFSYTYSDSSAVPTFVPWWYRDDPEFLDELVSLFDAHAFPMILWMGDFEWDSFDDGRGSQQEMGALAAASPENILGAGTYYNAAFSPDKRNMVAAEQRAWEMVSADCMWNPRWRRIALYERFAFSCETDPDVACIDASLYDKATLDKYYGVESKAGTQESVRVSGHGDTMISFMLPASTDDRPRRFLVRTFGRNEGSDTLVPLRMNINGQYSFHWVGSQGFVPMQKELEVPADTKWLNVRVTNLSGVSVLLDAVVLHEELPGFGYEVVNGQLRPNFPSDPDEHALSDGWHYCQDRDFLPAVP